jgi:hypothetical protein
MALAEFEPAIPASGRPQNHALDRAATGIGQLEHFNNIKMFVLSRVLNFYGS